MPSHHVRGVDDRLNRLAFISRLLERYRVTKDRRLLRQALELWDEVEADRTLQKSTSRKQIIH
jgi:hypothetical protein